MEICREFPGDVMDLIHILLYLIHKNISESSGSTVGFKQFFNFSERDDPKGISPKSPQ